MCVNGLIIGVRSLRSFPGIHVQFCSTARRKPTGDDTACGVAIAATEKANRLPPQILNAIGIVESGRVDRRTGLIAPWPFAINVAGRGCDVRQRRTRPSPRCRPRRARVSSPSTWAACRSTSPTTRTRVRQLTGSVRSRRQNVRYAAVLPRPALSPRAGGDWGNAIGAYHSANPAFGPAYAQTVAAVWRLGPRYVLTAHAGVAAWPVPRRRGRSRPRPDG